jgi:hypothetical protein
MNFWNWLNIACNKFYSKQYITIFAPLKKSGRVASTSLAFVEYGGQAASPRNKVA